LPWSSI